ncbi:hypothetical protein [Niastella caeni]|nr:hypothetical protein [Niastella caeni]
MLSTLVSMVYDLNFTTTFLEYGAPSASYGRWFLCVDGVFPTVTYPSHWV